MFDIGWFEILVILVIAVVVVGPKDLPKIVRTIGRWRGKMSAYARDFQRTMEDAANVGEMDAIKKEIAEANRELNDANRDLKETTAGVHSDISSDMNAATKDTTIVRLNEDGSVTEPGAAPTANAAAAEPTPPPGESQEKSANA
jgi:sec-independent protein translocase protein TatB